MSNSELSREIAWFRFGLIADLVHLPPGSKGMYARLKKKADGAYTIPGGNRTKVAAETIRDWLKQYRKGGFDALLPKPRRDRGRSRALPWAVADVLTGIKEDNPKLSVALVVREARTRDEVPEDLPLPPSTVHRLLARNGLMEKSADEPESKDRRRFAYRHAGQLWMSDVMHGPAVGEAQARLEHLLEPRGIGLITGEVGSGKTTVCRRLAASLHPGLYRLFYVPLSTGNVMDRHTSPSVGRWGCLRNATVPRPSAPSVRRLLD